MSNLFSRTAATTSTSRTASLNLTAVASQTSQTTPGAGLSAAELDAELVSALPAREEMCGSHHWCHHHHHDCDDRRYDRDDDRCDYDRCDYDRCDDSGRFKITFGGNPPVYQPPIIQLPVVPIGPAKL